MSDLLLDTNPSSRATPQAVKRTDLFGSPGELTLAEVSMFSAGTTNPQGVIALRTLNMRRGREALRPLARTAAPPGCSRASWQDVDWGKAKCSLRDPMVVNTREKGV